MQKSSGKWRVINEEQGQRARAFLHHVAVRAIQLFPLLLFAPHIQITEAPLPDVMGPRRCSVLATRVKM